MLTNTLPAVARVLVMGTAPYDDISDFTRQEGQLPQDDLRKIRKDGRKDTAEMTTNKPTAKTLLSSNTRLLSSHTVMSFSN